MYKRSIGVLLWISMIFLPSAHAQAWDVNDTLLETLYIATHVVDWGQTRDIAAQCESGYYYETNPIIGRCPSTKRVNTYFVSTALLHIGVARLLPQAYRRAFQAGTIGMQMSYVTNNAKIGLSVNF